MPLLHACLAEKEGSQGQQTGRAKRWQGPTLRPLLVGSWHLLEAQYPRSYPPFQLTRYPASELSTTMAFPATTRPAGRAMESSTSGLTAAPKAQ